MSFQRELPPGFVYVAPRSNVVSVSCDPPDSIKGTERILFVDDEQILVDLTCAMLERLGYKVTGYADAKDAFQEFVKAPDDFDLVLTDQTMQGMDGLNLMVRIKDVRADMPVVICTGLSDNISIEDLVINGCSGLVSKPYSLVQLGETVRQVLAMKL